MKKCPFCAEEIKNEAIKCRYCGSNLEPQPEPEPKSMRPAFLTSLLFGVGMACLIASYTSRSILDIRITNIFLNILIYGLFCSVFIWIWRVVIKNTATPFSFESGLFSIQIFVIAFLLIIAAFMIFGLR